MNTLNKFIKRIFDIVCSGLGLIVLSPFLLFVAIRIKSGSDGPVFFKQIRVGEKGKEFEILKKTRFFLLIMSGCIKCKTMLPALIFIAKPESLHFTYRICYCQT